MTMIDPELDQARLAQPLRVVPGHADLEDAVHTAKAASLGDSNDEEIEALQDALDEALRLLDRGDLMALDPEDCLTPADRERWGLG